MFSRPNRSVLAFLWLIFFVAMSLAAHGQTTATGQWTWVGGSTKPAPEALGPIPVFGTMGVPAATNTPGGRKEYLSWRDAQGNFWMFGGFDQLSDLWKYDTTTSYWTWMAGAHSDSCQSQPCGNWGIYGTLGVPDPDNTPSGRWLSGTFVGNDGNLWAFGGYGMDSQQWYGDLNDLWKYDPISNEWTWMSGSSSLPCSSSTTVICSAQAVHGVKGVPDKANTPGGLEEFAAWSTPDGKLWIYGGAGGDSQDTRGYSDDLWSYEIGTGMWTWVSGSGKLTPLALPPASYGTKGQAAVSNQPGGRLNAITWTDHAGRLWLFSGDVAVPNDLWQYDPATNEWTWISGSSSVSCNLDGACPNGAGVYGIKGMASPNNTPGMRTGSAAWTATDGTLWMYGGLGADGVGEVGASGGSHTYLNDLWQFDPDTREWTWVNGTSLQPCSPLVSGISVYGDFCWTSANFGVEGTADPANTPGSRTSLGGWRDAAGNLRLFGGDYFFGMTDPDVTPLDASMDDLWTFRPASAFNRVTAAPKFSLGGGIYTSAQSVTITDADAGAAIYYTTDGTTPTENSELYTGPIQLDQNGVLKAIAVASDAAPSGVTQASYVFQWSFSLAMATGSPVEVDIPLGGAGNFTLAGIPVLNSTFPSDVSFSVSGLPEGATGTFNPSSISKGSSRTKVTLSVQTRGASAAIRADRSKPELFLCFIALPFALLTARRRMNGALRILLCAIALALSLGAVSACGGGGASSGGSGGSGGGPTPAGTYSLVVTATCGQSKASITVKAVVQ